MILGCMSVYVSEGQAQTEKHYLHRKAHMKFNISPQSKAMVIPVDYVFMYYSNVLEW